MIIALVERMSIVIIITFLVMNIPYIRHRLGHLSLFIRALVAVIFLLSIILTVRPLGDVSQFISDLGIPVLIMLGLANMILTMMMKAAMKDNDHDVASNSREAMQISKQLEIEKLRVLLKDTELRSLQAQINPHFLFNTLNTIVSLIRSNPDQARTVMVHLSNFMRMNLKLMSSHLVSLEQELCLLESYIKIIQVRFAEQLTIELDIDKDLTHFKLPPATIQPLVENSIQHGLKKTSKGGKVVISIHRIEYGVRVSIRDNGSGIEKERLENLAKKQIFSRSGNGIGVYNVNQRLTALLGEESQLAIQNLEEGGCEVAFLLPMIQPERSFY